jgi:hypothetical protein
LSWSPHMQKSSAIELLFSNRVSIPIHKETKKDWALDPKGLASTYLEIQHLVTRVNDALKSCGLAWCKCWFKCKGFQTLLEPCLEEQPKKKNECYHKQKAKIPWGLRRRTNTSTMGSMSWTNARSTRSMSTSMA